MEESVPLKDFLALQEKYNRLAREYDEAILRGQKARAKLSEAKATVQAWQRYIDSHPKYQGGGRPSQPHGPSRSVCSGTEKSQTSAECATFARRRSANDSPPNGTQDIFQAGAEGPISLHQASSQSTQIPSDEVEPPGDVELADEDDAPEFVSERQIRKPRRQPVRIKREETQGSAPSPPQTPSLQRTYTQISNLDDVVAQVDTPRKRRRLLNSKNERSHIDTSKATLDEKVAGIIRTSSDENEPPASSQTLSQTVSPSARSRSTVQPLQPLSANIPNRPPENTAGTATEKVPRTRKSERNAAKVAALAEDGASYISPGQLARKRARKLEGLLYGEDGPTHLLTPRRGTSGRQSSPRNEPICSSSSSTAGRVRPNDERKTLPSGNMTNARPGHVLSGPGRRTPPPMDRGPRHHQDAPRPPWPEEEPLRAKPLHRLGIDDFKINPLFAGTDFAYNGPSDDRIIRRCLPGCTRECCHSVIAFGGVDRPRGRTDAREGHDLDEDAILRAHLGQDPSMLTPSQRESLLESARAQQVLSRYGKHKQVFERRRTPPGFWRTEFPDTQERKQDRRDVDEQTRQEVESRWREAVRGDGRGRWIFRDEGTPPVRLDR